MVVTSNSMLWPSQNFLLPNYCNQKTKIFAMPIFLLSLTHAMVEKVLFCENFVDLHVMRTRKSHFWGMGLCVCASVISITQKQKTAETSNLMFYICIIHTPYLKLFIKIGQKLCVQGHTKEF